jgi:hypothetical protein
MAQEDRRKWTYAGTADEREDALMAMAFVALRRYEDMGSRSASGREGATYRSISSLA